MINTLEIVVGKGNGRHSRPERHRIHLVHRSELLFPRTVGASTVGKPSDDGVDYFPVVFPLVLPWGVFFAWRVILPRPPL